MKFGVTLLVISAILFTVGYNYKEYDIDVNHTCTFFGLLFMMCGGAALIGGEK